MLIASVRVACGGKDSIGGRGGYADVWLAYHPSSLRPTARVVVRADRKLQRAMAELTAARWDGEQWFLLATSLAEVEALLRRIEVSSATDSL